LLRSATSYIIFPSTSKISAGYGGDNRYRNHKIRNQFRVEVRLDMWEFASTHYKCLKCGTEEYCIKKC